MQDFTKLVDKRVLVVGYGLSGQSVVRFLKTKNSTISVSDLKLSDETAHQLKNEGIQVERGQHTDQFFCQQDLIVISPGVDVLIPACQAAMKKQIPIVGEIELASHFINAPLITITGTNGKTTTTHLIHHLLSGLGKKSVMAGNVGYPLMDVVLENNHPDVIVVELSSFQLETIHSLKPAVALLLNINLDHLDRYPTMEAYQRAKERMFEFQTQEDAAVINKPRVEQLYSQLKSQIFNYNDTDSFIDEQKTIQIKIKNQTYRFSTNKANLQEPHNLDNMQASLLSVLLYLHRFDKAPTSEIIHLLQHSLENFKGLTHRCELIVKKNNVAFYNDSKATNPSAVEAALRNFPKKSVILLAGGLYKETGLEEMRQAVEEKVLHMVAFGSSAQLFFDTFKSNVTSSICSTMEEALNLAMDVARETTSPNQNLNILLSPACASYDQFKNYKERGDILKKMVIEKTR